MWLQHFFRASPQTVPSWRSWIGYRWKLLRWSTPWSKFFLVLEIELRDQNCPFHAVCGKILSQTAGGIFERKNSFRRTSLKLSEPNSAFETLNGKSSYVPPESQDMAWLPLRFFFVENSWYRYAAHIFLWRTINLRYSRQAERIFITNSLRKSSPGTRPSGSKMLLHEHLKKGNDRCCYLSLILLMQEWFFYSPDPGQG